MRCRAAVESRNLGTNLFKLLTLGLIFQLGACAGSADAAAPMGPGAQARTSL